MKPVRHIIKLRKALDSSVVMPSLAVRHLLQLIFRIRLRVLGNGHFMVAHHSLQSKYLAL